MEVTLEVLIGITVVLALVAIGLVVFLIRAFRSSRSDRPPQKHVPVAPETAQTELALTPQAEPVVPFAEPLDEPPPVPESPLAPPLEQPVRPDEALLMQVWQDAEGYLVVEVEGQRYRRLFDIQDGNVGRRVLEIIARLVAFSKGQMSRAKPPASQADEPDAAPQDETVEAQTRAVIDQWKQQPETPSRKSRLTADPVPFRRKSEAQVRGLTLNLAEEIDQLLQVRINATPQLSGRHVRVANAPDGGLRFEADGIRYATLEEIPDPEVQAVIRAAIKDWELRR